VLYLSLHGDAEECDEVHDEDRPEHRDVEQLKESAAEGDHGGLGGRVPELELGQPPDERSELLVLPGWELHSFIVIEIGHGRVNPWRQESKEQI